VRPTTLAIVLGLAFGIALTARPAAARIVIMEPSVVYRCPNARSWELLEKCLQTLGRPTVLRSLPSVRLVTVASASDPKVSLGLFVYVQRKHEWRLGGLREGDFDTVLGFEAVTINRHQGYRLDVGTTVRTTVARADASGSPALLRRHEIAFCGGDSYGCTQVTTLCEVYVGGKILHLFRGTLAIEDQNQLRLDGDRAQAGAACQVAERAFLGWSPSP
jgi:hypothetical protein